ncbi:hypothetical protein K505DRAFT_231459, partial [Melanomma pulvis-pyrius CBS 109.77]
NTSQSVTYSTRAIENVSDIMDALNISTSMSIKYGTIHGNGNASFVNENKVLDSELNYVVSVIVNNDALAATEDMDFLDIPGLPLERFTEVYGDSFISGFTEGGEFNAVVSIKLNDKSKFKAVKQAVDVQLAVGPPTLEIGAKESIDKEHSEALRNTEISISVNWVGGGEIKKPKVPWTIKSVVAIANAFPSMVARSSARTQAILTRYTSLRTFQAGKERYEEPVIILNYVPCSLYTADLFDALMIYKRLWKRIGEIEEGASGWNLLENNLRQDPIPPEPVALNEARLLCREAMTLITEEVRAHQA